MKRFPELVLMLVTVIWGSTFLITRTALQHTGPFTFLAIRFWVGAVIVAMFVRRRPTKAEWVGGCAIGVSMVIAYSLQTIGLQTISSAKSAFITALYVPLVPILQKPVTGTSPSRSAWIGAMVSFLGLAGLSMDGSWSFTWGLGETLTLLCAIGSAMQIVLISRHSESGDSTTVTAIQLGFTAVVTTLLLPMDHTIRLGAITWVIGIGMGVVATAGALWAMNWAQKSVSASRATLIYAMEPAWAALVGALAGEALGITTAIGGGLIVLGMLIGEFEWFSRRETCTAAA